MQNRGFATTGRRAAAPPAPSTRSRGWDLAACLVALGVILWTMTLTFGYLTADWSAHRSQGVSGTFVVTQFPCGRNCAGVGDFTPAGGRTPTLRGVQLMSGDQVRSVGQVVPAESYDGHVYPPGGGDAWVTAALFSLGAVAALVAWIRVFLLRPVLRRLRRRRGPRVTPTV